MFEQCLRLLNFIVPEKLVGIFKLKSRLWEFEKCTFGPRNKIDYVCVADWQLYLIFSHESVTE